MWNTLSETLHDWTRLDVTTVERLVKSLFVLAILLAVRLILGFTLSTQLVTKPPHPS